MKLFRSLILYEHYYFELLVYTTVDRFSYLLHVVLVEQLKHRESEHFAANKMKLLKKVKNFIWFETDYFFSSTDIEPYCMVQ